MDTGRVLELEDGAPHDDFYGRGVGQAGDVDIDFVLLGTSEAGPNHVHHYVLFVENYERGLKTNFRGQ